MKPILKFLIEAGKLKKMPRTGFVWLGIKNPETIAQHLFRVAILNWVLAKEAKNLDLTKVIQISLVHDLCEVYAGDVTPYWGLLPHDKEKRKEILTRWVRLPKKIKKQRDKKKFAKEKESLKKLVKRLNPRLKEEITNCWFEYEKMLTKEGRFVKQGDKIETLLQAIEYWGANLDSPVLGWWEEVRELTDNPLLLQFLTKIEDKFYKKQKSSAELDFLLKIGKLKTMPRTGWVLRGVSNPETIAEHTFLSTIASWVFADGRGLVAALALGAEGVDQPLVQIGANGAAEGRQVADRLPAPGLEPGEPVQHGRSASSGEPQQAGRRRGRGDRETAYLRAGIGAARAGGKEREGGQEETGCHRGKIVGSGRGGEESRRNQRGGGSQTRPHWGRLPAPGPAG